MPSDNFVIEFLPSLITARDPCNPNPCKNGGKCTPNGDKFTCSCTAGWKGDTCETSNLLIMKIALVNLFLKIS